MYSGLIQIFVAIVFIIGIKTLEISPELIMMAIFIVTNNIITIRWLKSDLSKHEKIHEEYVASHAVTTDSVRGNIDKLYAKSNKIMVRKDVEEVVKKEVAPLIKEMEMLVDSMSAMGKTVQSTDKAVAIMFDRDQNKSSARRAKPRKTS